MKQNKYKHLKVLLALIQSMLQCNIIMLQGYNKGGRW